MDDGEYEELRRSFAEILSRTLWVSVVMHDDPDGDTIGTSLAFYRILKMSGFRVEVCCASGEIAPYYDFLYGFSAIKRKMEYGDSTVIVCDCASESRFGFDIGGRVSVNVDHHRDNTMFGTLNIVDSQAPSCAEVAYLLLDGLYPMDGDCANALYTGIYSDTSGFSTSGVGKRTLETALALSAVGAEPSYVAYNLLHRRSLSSVRLLGRALSVLKLDCSGRLAIMSLEKSDMVWAGASYPDLDGIVEYGRSLATVEISALIVEMEDFVKVSLRSKGRDVSAIARIFGGGGHPEASAFRVYGGDMDEVRRRLVVSIEEIFDNRGGV